jgi:hypothetical protein
MKHSFNSKHTQGNAVKNAHYKDLDSGIANHPNQYCYRLVEKALEIDLILNEPEIDLWLLRELALTEGGLVNGTYFAP